MKNMALSRKHFENVRSRSSDSGKSSSCSPILLDFSYDSGDYLDDKNKVLRKRIMQCTYILLSLERDQENFRTIRNRLSKITDKRKRLPNEYEDVCNVCCLDIDHTDDKTFVKCAICKQRICRRLKCASWLPESSQWKCELCKKSEESLAQTSSWVAEQISFHQEKCINPVRARSEIYIPISDYNDSSMHLESASLIDANSTVISAEQKLKIRQYVEEILAEIFGGNLDTIAINQLSKSENYLTDLKITKNTTCDNKYVTLDKDSPDLSAVSEARLRQMIQKIIAETINLPLLSSFNAESEIAHDTSAKRPSRNGYYQRHRTERYFEPKIYQDLLATAVLNKIVDTKLNRDQDKNLNTEEKSGETMKVDIGQADLDLENNLNIENLSTTSGSSVEPRSDFSYSDVDHILNANEEKSFELLHNIEQDDSAVSDYLPSHRVSLPDLMAVPTESEDDYLSVTSSAIEDGTWEKNWLFRKKKHHLSGSATISSVGMLVPDPTEDIRAQIGDKTADEVSDLSELGSDTDDSLDILQTKLDPINYRLINKHLIGGDNDKMVLDELIERSNIASKTLPTKREPLVIHANTLNEHVENASTEDETANNSVNQQKTDLHVDNCDNTKSKSPPIDLKDTYGCSVEDQISHDSYPNNNSRTTTVEDYIDYNDQKEFSNNCIDNSLVAATTINTITTTTTTFTELIPIKSTNNLTITNFNHDIEVNLPIMHNTTNKSPNELLTSAVQNKDVSASCFPTARKILNGCMHEHQIILDKTIINDGDGDNGNKCEDDDNNDDLSLLRHFLPGSIAEREYKKWYNAVEMPNNPYAPEALKRRISGSQERFIDLPNISPIKELNILKSLKTDTLDSDETQKRENDYKRYSRDYYINSSSTSSQSTPVKELSAHKDTNEHTNCILSYENDETNFDLYKATPVQVVQENNSSTVDSSQLLKLSDLEGGGITTTVTESDDSDTLKIKNLHAHETAEKCKVEIRPNEMCKKIENCANNSILSRGSTPTAFKFLQPKRKLLKPNQVLSVDEDETHVVTTTHDKPVIEEEVAKALPSVKALARAFLMTTNTTQPEKLWLRKARTLSQSGKKIQPNAEEDVTITSDLSSLETDSSSVQREAKVTSTGCPDSLPIRQGDFKSNIAFFENLKNK